MCPHSLPIPIASKLRRYVLIVCHAITVRNPSTLEIRRVYDLRVIRSDDNVGRCGQVALYPFDDHGVPPLSLIKSFCEDMEDWLGQDPVHLSRRCVLAHYVAETTCMYCMFIVYTIDKVRNYLHVHSLYHRQCT